MPEPLIPFGKNTDAATEDVQLTWAYVPHALLSGAARVGKTSLARRVSTAAADRAGGRAETGSDENV